MKKRNKQIIFSPFDLTKFIESEFITWMDRYNLEFPGEVEQDPESETNKLLQKRGIEHEKNFLKRLQEEGRKVTDISKHPKNDQYEATVQAMKDGREVIYQAALKDNEFGGFSDFLFLKKGKSSLGDYQYEPWDTKLALKEKPYFLVQLACYSDMITKIQEVLPRQVHVLLGDNKTKSFRTEDFLYYYRQSRKALLEQQQNWTKDNPPDFMGLEEFGRWTTHAEKVIREKDHLCQVANIRSVQIKKLYKSDINTMTDLANTELSSIPRMQAATFDTLKEQARLQIDSFSLEKPKFELIEQVVEGKGLTNLPTLSPLDVYFDIEGFPLTDDGLEYLLGATVIEDGKSVFYDWWAHDSVQEKESFESFVDWIYERWKVDPTMHVYHYASYEKTALRRLMGKYGTKEKEVDDLLRNEVLVDLFSIVRQSIRVGEPSYSLKYIEHLYMDKRKADVATAIDSVVQYQNWIDSSESDDWTTSKILSDIRDYNIEDCESTWKLAIWLRALQNENRIEWKGRDIKETPESNAAQFRQRASLLAAELLEGVSVDDDLKTESMRVREMLAYLLEFHWREAKPVFWAKYDRAEMNEEELFEDPGCLAGLERTATPRQSVARSYSYEFKYDPDQDTKIDAGTSCFFAHDLEQKITVAEIQPDSGFVYLKRIKSAEAPPTNLSLIRDEYVNANVIAESVFRVAETYQSSGKLPQTVEDFLSRSAPRVVGWDGGQLIPSGVDLSEAASDVVSRLNNSVLCIQGPPGSGKTYTAAKSIVKLISMGKRVGVTSNSHKAVANLMDKVAQQFAEVGGRLNAAKVQSKPEDFHVESANIQAIKTNVLFDNGYSGFNLIGGTAWLFSRPEANSMVDFLFVDEAGQVSVANLIGMAPSTENIVLVGDQMQLAQPIQGTHPGESGQSTLEYLLKDKKVVPDDFGIFLGESWRRVCKIVCVVRRESREKEEVIEH